MVQTTLNAKSTKAEIMDEYEKLRGQLEQVKSNASTVHEPQNREIIARAKSHDVEAVSQSIGRLKMSVDGGLSDLSAHVRGQLDGLLSGILTEVKRFDEIQQAIDLSRKTLDSQHHIQIAADTVEKLVADFEAKRTAFEREAAEGRQSLDAETATRKRDWAREQEEYEYATRLKRQRENEQFEEEKARRERELAEREAALSVREGEADALKRKVEGMPTEIAAAVSMKEKEVWGRCDAEWKAKLEVARREWETEKRIAELRTDSFEAQIKRLETENALLKKEAEAANKKTQELAVKVIEKGGSGSPAQAESVARSV